MSEGLTIRKVGKEYEVFSTDEKYNKIGQKYGYEQFGLNEEQLNEVFDELYQFAYETILNDLWE